MADLENFEVNQKRSITFVGVLFISLAMQLGILYRPLYFMFLYPEPEKLELSNWYLWASIAFALTAILGTFLTYFFRKIGVYLIMVSYFLIIVLQPQFSMTGSVATIFALFFFTVFGLLSIIPRWKSFK